MQDGHSELEQRLARGRERQAAREAGTLAVPPQPLGERLAPLFKWGAYALLAAAVLVGFFAWRASEPEAGLSALDRAPPGMGRMSPALVFIAILATAIVFAQVGLKRLRGARARAWAARLPFAVNGFDRLVREGWRDVSVRVQTDAPVGDLTALAHQLDDDAIVEGAAGEVRVDRVPASHGDAARWGRGILREVLVPLSKVTAVREVTFSEEIRTAFQRRR